MSTRDEALTAVLNAARAVRTNFPTLEGMPPSWAHHLRPLYTAIDAVDIVDAFACPEPRPGLCQGDPECWRYADVGVTCFHHSPAAQQPRPFESLRQRAPELAVQDE